MSNEKIKPCPITKDELRKAFSADLQQLTSQTCTPDRAYETPVDNLFNLFNEAWNRRAEGWRPISEAPKDAQSVDLWCESKDSRWVPCRIADCRFVDEQWHCTDQWGDPSTLPTWAIPTHFMPLPEPPKEGGGV